MNPLHDDTRELLQVAALVGRDVELGLLARAAGLDIETCLDRLEPAVDLGVMVPAPDDPFVYRFAHDLVREAVVETTPPLRASRLHLRIADALERTHLGGAAYVERLAHHLWSAGPLADPARTGRALIRAGTLAVNKSAFVVAEERAGNAVDLAHRAVDDEAELEALILLISVTGTTLGYVGAQGDLLERAEVLARAANKTRLVAGLLFSRWSALSQGIQLDASEPLARELYDLAISSEDPVLRTYGHHAWGIDRWDRGQIGAARRTLEHNDAQLGEWLRGAAADEWSMPFDPWLLTPVFLAHMLGLSNELDASRRRFATVEAASQSPYELTVWATFCAYTGALAGDVEWTRHPTSVYLGIDPEMIFEFLGTYIRLVAAWARSMSSDDGSGLEEIRALVDRLRSGSARSGDHAMHILYAEALLHAGHLDLAEAVLDEAQASIDRWKQCYAEPLMWVVRARLAHARGASRHEVERLAAVGREMAAAREAHLFVARTDALLAELYGAR